MKIMRSVVMSFLCILALATPLHAVSTLVIPNRGPYSGGNMITVTNGSFANVTNVLVGGVRGTLGAHGASWFTLTLPATGSAGVKDIVVQTSDSGAITLAGAYTVNPAGKIGRMENGPNVWTNMGSSMAVVYSLAYNGGNLYAGGLFTNAGGVPANYVAKWNGATGAWTNLGSGLNNIVDALAGDGTNLYAGGYFTAAAGVSTKYVAKWNAATGVWTNLADGVNNWVFALAYQGGNLFAVGDFTTAGGVSANHVAKWSPATGAWTNLGSGISEGPVVALACDGVNLYAGGTFTTAGGVSAKYVAKWDAATGAWTNLGSGLNGKVNALACDGTNLYAAGRFTTAGGVSANHVAKWNTASGAWTNLGSGIGIDVLALDHDGANLYAGGSFTNAGGVSANHVAKWDTATGAWTNLGSGVNDTVFAAAHDATNFYAGNVSKWGPSIVENPGVAPASGSYAGGYTVTIIGSNLGNGSDITSVTLGGVSAAIQSQSATQVVMTAGVSGAAGLGDVRVMSTSFGETVRSNAFTYTAPGVQVLGVNGAVIASGAGVSALNGTRFAPLLQGRAITNTFSITNNGTALLTISGAGVQGSGFSVQGLPATVPVGGASLFSVAYAPSLAGSHTAALVISNDSLTAAYTVNLAGSCYQLSTNVGAFSGGGTITITNGGFGNITNVLVGGVQATLVSQGATWFTITLPATGSAGVKDIVVQTSDSGDITLAGDYTVNPAGKIGRTDYGPNVWTNLGSGVNDNVSALEIDGANLYAGGYFTNAGGVTANNVAKWDAASGTWTNLEKGILNYVSPFVNVSALERDGANLYAGGYFTNAGGVTVKNIAKWDAASGTWTNLGSGMSSDVNVLVCDGTNLYAGGLFTTAGGVTANKVAKWDAASGTWTNLGSGINGSVSALAGDGTNLYAGGSFNNAGGVSALRVAKWDAASGTWTSLGSGMNGVVRALVFDGANLYAGGTFTMAGGVWSRYVAKWNAASGTWTNMGSGVSGYVNALAFDGTNLYAGGAFTDAGGVAANYVAKWDAASGSWTNLGSGMNSSVNALAYDGTNLYAGGTFTNAAGVSANRVANWGPSIVENPGVAPESGASTGGYTVTIVGSNIGNGSDITSVTLCGVSAAIQSQSATQVVVTAGFSGAAGLGDVRVVSTSFGETMKSNAFTYYFVPGLQVLGVNGAVIASGDGVSPLNGTRFAPIVMGRAITNIFSITNNGTALLTIGGAGVQGSGFSVQGMPATVPVGGVSSFTVAYAPSAVGSHTAALVISNDSPIAAYTVNLAGSCYQLSANAGAFSGGNTITITNGGFGNITNVLVGGVQATLGAHGATWFTITLPATGSAGVKDIVVQTSDNGDITLAGAYAVNPAGKIGWTDYGTNVWTRLGSGMSGIVNALALDGANLYAGGIFTNAGGKLANYVAKWNAASGTWTNLGAGLNSNVNALVFDGTNLYAGGVFTNAGGGVANRVAKWDAASGTWTNLGSGLGGTALALTLDGVNLVVGGNFNTAGGVTANRIAKWDAASGAWTNLGSGLGNAVRAVAPDGSNLYVAGDFLTAGGVSANMVAKWNAATGAWTNLGSGFSSTIKSLARDGSILYACGSSFTNAGGVPANRIAKWDAVSGTWTNLGSGMAIEVDAVAVDGSNLYAGGGFTNAGGVTANRIAKWDAASGSWTNLGSGISGTVVYALAIEGPNLYAGGNFTNAGGKTANYVAKWGPSSITVKSGVAPASGSYAGGYPVVITGTNLGSGSDITSVTLGGVSAEIQSQSATQVVVTAGVSGSAGPGDVRVVSTSFGETVKSNAFTYTAPGLQVLGVNGAVIPSGAGVSPLNGTRFAPTIPGATVTRSFNITNNGTALLTIGGAGVQGSGFSVQGMPATVPVGGVSPFTVAYAPSAVGSHTAALVISNDSLTAAYTVNLAGSCYQLSTNVGAFSGGDTITITNAGFGDITNVLVGGVRATLGAHGATWFTITLPATGSAGVKDIVVQTSDNVDITLAGAYTVHPAGVIGRTDYGPYVWTNLGSGMDHVVLTLAHDGTNLYAGGQFTNAGGVTANRVAKWDPATGSWTNLGSGMSGNVTALELDGADLYAGGWFTNAGGIPANYVAKWDAASGSWTNMGDGLNGAVTALACDGANLYAGGNFSTAGGVSSRRVAKWDAASGSWTNLGSGLNSSVFALACDGTNLYVGGDFTNAGGVTANRVAKWDPATGVWTNLGSGVNAVVYALACDGTNLYAAGDFTNAGGKAVNRVAKWDPATGAWTNLASGMSYYVSALALDGVNLYAGGIFTNAGGVTASRSAKWDAASEGWTNLGSGVSGPVMALAYEGVNLYAGGQFANAGGVSANYVAKSCPSSITQVPGVAPSSGASTGGYTVTINGSNLGNGGDITSVTLGGVSAEIQSQSDQQVVVTAGAAAAVGTGDVRIVSTSFGETVKSNAFEYLRAAQIPLVFTPASPQAYGTTNGLSIEGGSGTGAVSYLVQSGPGSLVGLTNLTVTSGSDSVVVVATKAADSLYNALSATATVTCVKATQSITFAPIASQLTTNTVRLAATASSGFTVTFSVDSGLASITGLTNLTFTGAGPVSIVASQAGDTNWNEAVTVTNTFTVSLADQTPLTFAPSSPQVYGTTNLLAAQQQPSARILVQPGPPASGYGTGAVSYAVQSGPGLIVESNKLTVTSGTGSVVVVATKAADSLYKACSATATVTCAKAAQSISFAPVSSQLTTNTVGLVATANSGNTVTFTVDSGRALITGLTTLTFTGAGSVSIVASQSGDANWSAAASVTNTFTVSLVEQGVLTFAPASPQAYGTTNALSLTGASGTGAVSYVVQSGPGTIVGLTNLTVISGTGSVVVVATKGADSLYSARSATATVTCAKAAQAITFAPIASQLTTNTMGLAATANSGLSVSFTVGFGPALITGGTNMTFNGAGSVSIVASQAGDTNWNAGASVTNTFNVSLVDQAPLIFSPASPQTYGTTNLLAAQQQPSGIIIHQPSPPASGYGTGAVSYAVQSGPGLIVESNKLTVTSGTGSVVVVATKAADSLYKACSATATVTCAKAPQTIAFPAIGDQFWTNVVGLAVTASSGLTPALEVVSGPAAITGTNLSFTGYGAVKLTAAQAGNDNYSAASTVTNSFTVVGPLLVVLGTNGVALANSNELSVADGTDFGTGIAGLSVLTNTFAFTNAGTAEMTISGISTSGAGAGCFALLSPTSVIAASSAAQIQVVFTPLSGRQDAAFALSFNGTNSPYLLNVTGLGLGGGIALATSAVAYAATYAAGNPDEQGVGLSNIGLSGFSYTNVIAYGAGASGWLAVQPAAGTVATGGAATLTFGVTSTNLAAGVYVATNVVLSADATNSPQAVVITLTVGKGDQSISFADPGDQLITNRLTLAGAASSGLAVSYAVQSGPAALSALSNLTFTAGGTVVLVASQSGDSNWNAASNVIRSFLVWPVLTVTLSPAMAGETTPAPGDYRVSANVATAIQARASAGYYFVKWTQSSSGVVADLKADTTTVTLASNALVNALFRLNKIVVSTDVGAVAVPEGGAASFQVKLSAQGTGDVALAVTRVSGDTNLTVSAGASLTFTKENWSDYQTVTLSASEDNGDRMNGIAQFAIGAAGVTSAFVVVTEVDDDYTLTVTATNGMVTRSTIAKAKAALYDNGAEVELTATPYEGYLFGEWRGDATGTGNPVRVTMDSDKAVTAWFVPVAPRALPPLAIFKKAFTARWRWVKGGAPEGELSVAFDEGFTNLVAGCEALYVCNETELTVSGLQTNQDYWYRVRRVTECSGPSAWSKPVKVHTGLGMPAFTSLLNDVAVSKGPSQEFALTNLVRGAGVLTVRSSDTNNVEVLLTTNALYLSYLWKGAEVPVRVSMILTEPITGSKSTYQVELSEATGEVAVVGTGALTSAGGSRLAQDVTLENRTGGAVYGVRLRPDGLDDPAWLKNQTGYGLNTGDPYREVPCVLPAGSQMVVRVLLHVDYASQAASRPVVYRAAAVMPPLNEIQPQLFGLPLEQNAIYEGDGGMRLLGLPVVGNRLYTVGYSDDAGVSWVTNAPAIRATANFLMWLDLEGASNRVYQVKDTGL